jgi:hypothetical protein
MKPFLKHSRLKQWLAASLGGPSRDLGDNDDWDRTGAVGYVVAGDSRMDLMLRLVGIGTDGPSRSFDVMAISGPDGLGDIANLGMSLAVAQRLRQTRQCPESLRNSVTEDRCSIGPDQLVKRGGPGRSPKLLALPPSLLRDQVSAAAGHGSPPPGGRHPSKAARSLRCRPPSPIDLAATFQSRDVLHCRTCSAMTVLASKQHDEEVVEHLCQPRRML